MSKTVLISCSSKKSSVKSSVRNIYTSSLFKKSLAYAELLDPDNIFVLSAKYGLIGLDEEIEPYNQTLNSMTKSERKDWADQVISRLEEKVDLQKEQIIFFAGKKYREFLIPKIRNYQVPLGGLGIGEQLASLKSILKD